MSQSVPTIYALKSKRLFDIDQPVYTELPKFNKPFIDWLTITYNPLESTTIVDALNNFLPLIGCRCKTKNNSISTWTFPEHKGKLTIHKSMSSVKIELSGMYLQHLRYCIFYTAEGTAPLPAYEEVIAILSGRPYRITRLDVSMDVSRPFDAIETKLVTKCNRTKDGLSFTNGKQLNDRCSQYSKGNWKNSQYKIGSLRNVVSGVVYDKGLEQFQKYGIKSTEERSRYEIRIKHRDNDALNPSLEDCLNPAPLFYHYAHVLMLRKPANVSKWVSTANGTGWKRHNNLNYFDPFDKLADIVHTHTSDLVSIAENDTRFDKNMLANALIERANELHHKPSVLPTDQFNKISLQPNDTNRSDIFSGGSFLAGQHAPKPRRKLNYDLPEVA